MFLRFTKEDSNREQKFKKCVFLNGSLIMEYGDEIVGVAKLHEETDSFFDYDVIVAKRCPLGAEKIARFIKDTICKSNKFCTNPSSKRRKYYVEEVDCEVLPIMANITFSMI